MHFQGLVQLLRSPFIFIAIRIARAGYTPGRIKIPLIVDFNLPNLRKRQKFSPLACTSRFFRLEWFNNGKNYEYPQSPLHMWQQSINHPHQTRQRRDNDPDSVL